MLQILPAALDGERITLRGWRVEQAATLSALVQANLDHLRPWMPWIAHEPLTEPQRRELIAGWEQRRLAGGDAAYAVQVDDVPVGACGLNRRIGPDGLEIGYWISKTHCHKGYATEAAATLTAAALSMDGIRCVEIHHDTANLASAAVPQRLGYRFVDERPAVDPAPGGTGISRIWRTER